MKPSKKKQRLVLASIAVAIAAALSIGTFAYTASAHSGFPTYADINKATKYQTSDTFKTTCRI